MGSKAEILGEFNLFSIPAGGGITNWLGENTDGDIFERLGTINSDPLSLVQLNQLLVLGREAPVSDGFFRYYWLEAPGSHPYDVRSIPDFSESFFSKRISIVSLPHLKWGLYRLYVDALLYFGNVRTAFRKLRDLNYKEIRVIFAPERYDTEGTKSRGPALPLKHIARDDRYLISEMACKSYGDDASMNSDIFKALLEAYKKPREVGARVPTIRELLQDNVPAAVEARQQEFIFSAEEVLDESISSEAELMAKYDRVARKFSAARSAALNNTRYYLSMLSDLDVYVATSMRSRSDFRAMADTCDRIFTDGRLNNLNLRYFDPTLSAAAGHEDKGLIECLMVKCAKMLVYCAGDRDSYGKDAEAAMALSLGKPVIFYCTEDKRQRFYRDVHPLSRLIEFETGVAVGAMVTSKVEQVVELIYRIFENKMEYILEQPKPGYLRLKERLTESVVRIQTNDELLTETFWNHYHRDRSAKRKGVGSA